MSKSYKDYPVLPSGRINFSKISGSLELPNLVEIQTDSYKWFLETGIEEVMKEVFPIASYTETSFIDFVSCELREPKHSFLECKDHDYTYSSKLYVKLRLRNVDDGEMKEEEVFMGDIPLMTESGTFIVNGAERVIVSQIVRSPGAYISKEMDKNGKMIYNADLIPTRGTWLEFETDPKGLINVRIDRQKKMPATVILKALGLDNEKVLYSNFGKNPMLEQTIEKDKEIVTPTDALIHIFKKLKPGEPITTEGVANFLIQKFFDHKRYDLGRAGRFKYRSKLGIYSRLAGRYLAEDLKYIDENGEEQVYLAKGEYISKSTVLDMMDKEIFENGAHTVEIKPNKALVEALDRAAPKGKADPEISQIFSGKVNKLKVYVDEKMKETQYVIGTDLNLTVECLTFSDIIAIFSYLMNIMAGFGDVDDIDNLGNRRVRCVGELIQTQFRIGLTKMVKTVQQKMSISDMKTSSIKSLMNIKPLTSTIREFFASSQLSQFMDQTNPLSELANKRRISALGQGGITRDRASMAIRDVHPTHYGRICPIETPEGQNIGLINNLATYAKINKYGFIETPFRVVEKGGKVTDNAVYLSADDEKDHYIAQANVKMDENGYILDEEVVARHNGENVTVTPDMIDFIDVSPKQIVSIAAACIPFLENDDAKRALMGANMQRQALPLLKPETPYVGTGVEARVAKDAGLAVVSCSEGTVEYVDSRQIVVKENKGRRVYDLQKFQRSNQGTCINQTAIVKVGDKVKVGDILADGPSMKDGDLALGQNVTIAFMTWEGYNYEDAVIMSERLVKDDTYTTIHIEEYTIDCRDTKLGPEEITRDIPNVSEEARAYLDADGIILKGVEVKEGDILVGKTTPKGQSEPTPEEKLLMAIFAEKTKDTKDSSLRVPHGGAGIVVDIKIASREAGDELPPGVKKSVRVYIAQKRKISEGDKMSGRHGNKGVISRILPECDMPFLADGTPIDIMLNPLGVPSRMNIGQILEIHLGLACKKLGIKIATPVFDGITEKEIYDLMDKAGLDPDGKTVLYDGRTGERFDERISVGTMYMIKLVHMVDDKIHARATGPYSLVTQQPLGGKAQNGGQRFGEMEVWALEAYGAAHTLQEILTIKSDDRVGRRKTYEAIIKGQDIPEPGIPEAFNVLVKELSALCMDVRLIDKDGRKIDTDALAREAQKEERKINSAIRNLTGENHNDELEIIRDLEEADERLN